MLRRVLVQLLSRIELALLERQRGSWLSIKCPCLICGLCTQKNVLVQLCLQLIRSTVPRFRMSLATVTITPLELPEITTTVGKFLDRPDLVQCLYVCRVWHTSFLPLVWSAISIRSGERYPGVEAFNSHSQLIRNLAYDVQDWHAYESVHCRNVLTLHVYCNWDESPVIAQYDQLRQQAKKVPDMMSTHAGNPRIHFRTYHPLL